MQKYKVIIIGAGSAGLSAVDEIIKETDDYLLIQDGPLGTSCARVACMPTKALIEVADLYHCRHHFRKRGITGAEKLRLDPIKAMAYVRGLRDYFVSGMVAYSESLGDRLLSGRARLLSAHEVAVEEQRFTAERIIIATGSRPVIPEKWLPLRESLLTTDEFFEQTDLPARLAVIGLGPAGLEFAQALCRFGLAIQGIEVTTLIGGLSDPKVSDAAKAVFSSEFPLHLGVDAALEKSAGGIRVLAGSEDFTVDKVLLAIGRQPNLEGLGLESLSMELDNQGMPVYNDGTMQVGDLPVFIAGDANGRPALLHEAVDEGLIAGYNAVRGVAHCFQRRIPLAISFTEPNLATVGRRFSEFGSEEIVIGEHDFSRQARAMMSGRNTGLVRVYVAKSDGLLLGAEMAAPAAEHMAHLLALAIQQQLNVYQCLKMPFYHPVVEEGLRSALTEAARKLEGEFSIENLLCGSAPPSCIC
ncbi:MAG: dihydrolipoyl dehydrogenase [Deltaproteobacteria bacterium]